jgi:Mrp family chromosome partitioning ATPase
MGRIFEILKQADGDAAVAPTTLPFSEPTLAPRVLVAAPCDPEPASQLDEQAEDAEIPFIEVGPRKSMEASASVLAATPPKMNLPSVDLHERSAEEDARPRPVVFRPVPAEVLRRRRNSKIATEIIAFHDPDHAVSSQYRDLFTTLAGALPPGRSQALLFTSNVTDTATTDVLLNLAVTAARLGRRRIAVFDANLNAPAVARQLGLAGGTGLFQVLTGAVSVDEAILKTEQENLFALTAGADGLERGLRLVVETVRSVVRQLRQRFDLVFVDGPKWDGRANSLQTAIACDATYLVLPEKMADTPQVDELFQVLPDKGVRLAGCIFVGE